MSHKIMFTLAVCLSAASGAVAQDLPAAANQRSASLSGAALQSVRGAVAQRTARGVPEAQTVLRGLIERSVLRKRVAGRDYDWSVRTHPSLRRLILARALAGSAAPPSAAERLAELRAAQNSVSASALLARSAAMIAELHAASGFSADEKFVPVYQGGGAVGLGDPNSGKREVLVTQHRIVYRRHVGDVPVVGREGEFEVVFDAFGEVESIELPTDNYRAASQPTSAGTNTVASASARTSAGEGRSALAAAFRSAGFAAAPSAVDQRISKDGKNVTVRDLQCGLVDDSSAALRRGCVVQYTTDQDARADVLLID